MKSDERYWAVDLPGLTEENANAIAKGAERLNVVGASALNPRAFLTISLDRNTVRALESALRTASITDEIVRSMLEEFDDWLAYSGDSRDS